jgi:hypothetical protein
VAGIAYGQLHNRENSLGHGRSRTIHTVSPFEPERPPFRDEHWTCSFAGQRGPLNVVRSWPTLTGRRDDPGPLCSEVRRAAVFGGAP